jgi:D-Tyr-tRNAtyr deacylase
VKVYYEEKGKEVIAEFDKLYVKEVSVEKPKGLLGSLGVVCTFELWGDKASGKSIYFMTTEEPKKVKSFYNYDHPTNRNHYALPVSPQERELTKRALKEGRPQ